MKQGLMGECVKVWSTAGTERVCPHCMVLNGKMVGFDENFDIHGRVLFQGMHETPPAHPRCRCVILYKEVGEPKIPPPEYVSTLDQNEEAAINRYLGGEAYQINESLRNGKELDESEKEWVQNLDKALEKMPLYAGSLQRSLTPISQSGLDDFISEHQPGAVVEYASYTSMTAGASPYDPDGQIQIPILKSKRGRDIRQFNNSEQEVLYP